MQGFKAKWSNVSHSFLLELQNFTDKDNKNYYGDSELRVYNSKRNFLKLIRTEGPIYDFSFRPGSDDFVMVSGFMPAIPVLYKNYESTFTFPKCHRNTITRA